MDLPASVKCRGHNCDDVPSIMWVPSSAYIERELKHFPSPEEVLTFAKCRRHAGAFKPIFPLAVALREAERRQEEKKARTAANIRETTAAANGHKRPRKAA